ncbi:cleavage and polyadenylation specificity factor subunit 3-II isoform X2 [Macadamia integrifolia]|uniref:cleavage and polyadenylation specificity factor subunit 3-II isoform X2 n=1 Tax=Macadamia integrifolia TaxID=60698 RepID=UPI001C4F4A3F|nr:cleavage and polyadenylation specificity factor subunit 3-II isoform X2 [Macadamia integrifolia]XP_042501564.1 cleavage and polyadenylation specificity factor subunit 3-II isoform X2 [Macadamia integrifolia]XP_042501565.1 cleavage and polyadenylation specificity factor subunit 3-II isoform X2 [Macadamia integrifolia]
MAPTLTHIHILVMPTCFVLGSSPELQICEKIDKMHLLCSLNLFLIQYPTKALAPLMLEDFRKVMVDRRGEEEQFTYNHIMDCMKKVTAVDLKQTVQVDKDLQIRAYYAGHVLGAAMFYAKVGDSAIVYTGDYNMTPDRHLGAAQIDRLQLDLLITESTYATTVRDSKYGREREFLKAVHKCISGGGKVLIPTFALGRAQELCILLDDYWERMNLKIPIYFSAGLTIQANMYYKMLIGWTSQKIKDTYATRNAFDFKHVCSFDRSLINAPGPCVLFATPGMISGGFSLEVFKQWAPSEMNLVALPGYCVAGTIGHKLMSGKPTKIDLDKDTQIDVRCKIHQMSFSPHTDAKGIMDLVKFLSPKHVILVHGEKPKMATLKGRIRTELGIQCYDPANNETVCIPSTTYVKINATCTFIRNCLNPNPELLKSSQEGNYTDFKSLPLAHVRDEKVAEGILVMEKTKKARAVHQTELLPMLGMVENKLQFAYCCPLNMSSLEHFRSHELDRPCALSSSSSKNTEPSSSTKMLLSPDQCSWLQLLLLKLSQSLSEWSNIQQFPDHLQLDSFRVSVCSNTSCPYKCKEDVHDELSAIFFCCSWLVGDEKLAWKIISVMKDRDSTTAPR